MAKKPKTPFKPETQLVNAGRDPQAFHGFVNPPVYHASTVLYPTAEDQAAHRSRYQYGRRGTPTSEALENALTEIEGNGCAGVALLPSGLAAISTALISVAGAGDHILITDSVYRPTRNFCEGVFKRMGVETTYYDPMIGADIAKLIRPNTRAVFVEAPGSQSFEMQDIPAIVAAAHDKGALVMMDNTWATPLYFRAFEKGVDMQIQAGTKYIGGHSDIMFGCVSANVKTLKALKDTVYTMGLCVGPDDINPARYAACVRWACGCRVTTSPACGSRAGSSDGRKSRACFTQRWKAIPVIKSGSGIFPAPAAYSASCSSRRARKPSTPS